MRRPKARPESTHFAHRCIIGFVLVQFLLHRMSEFEHFLVVASIANRWVLAERRAQGGDLLGDDVEMRRAYVRLRWIVGDEECIRRIESERLEKAIDSVRSGQRAETLT